MDHILRKKAVDCRKLWSKCLTIAGTKFVPLCNGISGQIGSLVVDKNYVDEEFVIPIDTLVTDLTNEDNKDGAFPRAVSV